ncbi:DUF58 domain-containing protein [Paenibacillus endoradicis]|uniref:DUF58 domain-containing protein n=1 Tax=Paenibacillus endoradicis TaxID=2972487 RepID=UPI002158ABBC|nr:DUF58 domain-containing protein [Paenibacillus endoradicis]MCR8655865.1 DUF58 domain-containing protein [Paenibacillus endoradicis]MCR8658191.1 DUF58 domain-containing protein [Paenibacillus endoradicis]
MKSKRSWIGLLALYTCSLFYFLFQGGKTSLMLFGILNILLLYLSIGYWSGIRKVKGNRLIGYEGHNRQQTQIIAGHSLQITFSAKFTRIMPMPYVLVRENLIRHDGTKQVFEGTMVPGFRNESQWQYIIPHLKRGQYAFGSTICLSYDAFGLKSHSGELHISSAIQVFPQILSAKQWTELLRSHHGIFSSNSFSKHAKESTQQNGVRDYMHGDRLSKIHWGATARTGSWKSKDFEREAMKKSVVVLDRYVQVASSKDTDRLQQRFEISVSMAASILDYSMKNDSAIGLLSAGESYFYSNPSTGMAHHVGMMNHLMTVDADASKPLSQLLNHRMRELQGNNVLLIVTFELSNALLNTLKQIRSDSTLFYIASYTTAAEQLEAIAALSAFRIAGLRVIEINEWATIFDSLEGSGA